MNPIISIIIPIYNAEDFIDRCLESIQAQTFSNYEVILVNDGSKDNSENIIIDFIEDKPNWILFSKINEGTSPTRNFGINKSKGQYLAFIDADDFVEATYLEKLYTSIISSYSDLACCGYFDHSNLGVHALHNFSGNSAPTIGTNEFSKLLFSQIGGVLWDKLFNDQIIRDNNIQMSLNIYYYEDSLFILDYLCYAKSITIVNEPLYHYNRINEQSFTKKINYKWRQNIVNFNTEIERKLSVLNFTRSETEIIVAKNVSVFVLSVFDYDKLVVYRFSERYQIITAILEDPFIRDNFKMHDVRAVYNPFSFFIKNKMTVMVLFYSWILHQLKIIYLFAKKHRILPLKPKCNSLI